MEKLLQVKKVTITVNGKTFYAKTNAKGIATISVKVFKTGKFWAIVKFAGDSVYNAATKSIVCCKKISNNFFITSSFSFFYYKIS